jgi:hypothetical protein
LSASIISALAAQGFTIVRQPANTAEHFNVRNFIEHKGDPKLLAEFDALMLTRQPAMSDAELEREADKIAVSAVMCADHSGYIPEVERDIITLAKKYRG